MEKSSNILLIRALGPTYSTVNIPYGIISIANYVQRYSEHRVFLLDRYKDYWRGFRYIKKIIERFNIGIVGISALSSQKDDALYLTSMIKRNFSKTKVILGGIHFTAMPEEGLKYADAVVRGEGEKTFLRLVNEYIRFAKIEGVHEGVPLKDLDKIGYPSKRVVEKFFKMPVPEFSIISSRGCPFVCKFCLSADLKSRIARYHSVESTLDYVEMLIKELSIKEIRFDDDIFILSKKRVIKFCEGLRKRNLMKYKIRFSCFAHSGYGDKEMYEKMYKSGFRKIRIGVEFGDKQVLKINNKLQSIANVERTIKIIVDAGIKPACLFMIGGMGDNKDSIEKTISVAKYFKNEYSVSLSFALAQPFPGSDFLREAEEYGQVVNKDYFNYSNKKVSFIPSGMNKGELYNLFMKARMIDKKNFVEYLRETFRVHYLVKAIFDFIVSLYFKKIIHKYNKQCKI